MKTIILSRAPSEEYTRPDMTLRDFWKAVVGALGTLLAETQTVCKLFMQKWSGTGLVIWIMHASVLSTPFHPHAHSRSHHLLFTHRRAHCSNTGQSDMVRAEKECLPWMHAHLLINSADFRYTFISWSYAHSEQGWFSILAVLQTPLWFRTQY